MTQDRDRATVEKVIEAMATIADAEGMADDLLIPVWPAGPGDHMYPQLTVGAVREFQAAKASEAGHDLIGLSGDPSCGECGSDIMLYTDTGEIECRECEKVFDYFEERRVRQAEAEPVAWEYYYKTNGCPAYRSSDPECICWHGEGTGPVPSASHSDTEKLVTWREKRTTPPAPAPVVPEVNDE